MRIKEINLQHYGPLPKFIKEFDEGVHVIYGSNESGKTLLIDAVMKMLVGGKKFHSSMDRVEEKPSGYVLIDKDGEEIKLDEKENLETLMEIGSDELRNIFCIRDADLQISEETEFYERTQDKLAGLRSSDLRQIIKALRAKGRLTDGGQLANSQGTNYAKSVFTDARKLISEIADYIQKARNDNVETLELELIKTRSTLESFKETLETLDKAKSKHEFAKIQADYNDLVEANTEFKAIPTDKIAEIEGLIAKHEENPINKLEIQRNLDLYKKLSLTSLGLGALAIILAYVLTMPTIGYLVPLLFLVGGAYSLNQWISNNSVLSEVEQLESQIYSIGHQLEIESDTVSGIKSDLNAITEENEATRKTLYGKLEVVRSFFDIKTGEIDEIISQSLNSLAKLEKEIDDSVKMEYSETEYGSIKEEIEAIRERIDEINGQLTEHRDQLEDFKSRITDLNYSRFMGNELELIIDNLEALERAVPLLEALRDRIDLDKVATSEAIKIFQELETEEEQKITELFSKESSAVEIFKETTNGRYSDLRYDLDTGSIIVERPTGETLDVSKLSKGTRDQLYLAIRVALGEKILEGSPGFFIMDDAFLSSDDKRLKSQVELLEKLSKKGWQIIYVTTKKEALENISNITENEVITLKQLA